MPVHVGAGSSAIQIQSPLGEDPSSGASAGDLYYNTTDNAYKYYDGTRWKIISSESKNKCSRKKICPLQNVTK